MAYRPDADLLEEICVRLCEGEKTEGWTFEPHGPTWQSRDGAYQWVHGVDPEGRTHTLRVQIVPAG